MPLWQRSPIKQRTQIHQNEMTTKLYNYLRRLTQKAAYSEKASERKAAAFEKHGVTFADLLAEHERREKK